MPTKTIKVLTAIDKVAETGPKFRMPVLGERKFNFKTLLVAPAAAGLVLGPLLYLGNNEDAEPAELVQPAIGGATEGLGIGAGVVREFVEILLDLTERGFDAIGLEEFPDAVGNVTDRFTSGGFSNGVQRVEDFSIDFGN